MFKKTDLEIIATVFGKTVEELSSAISNEEEVALNLRLNGKVHTQEEIDALKKTHTDAGVEIGSKNLAKALGVELEAGEKDPTKVAAKYREKLTKELEQKFQNPNPTKEYEAAIKKQQELESKYNTLLDTYEKDKEKVKEWEDKYVQQVQESKRKTVNNKIINSFPEKMKQDRNDALLIFNNTFSIEENEEGKTVIKRGDTLVQNAVGDPETLENVVKGFTEEKKWIKVAGMGGDATGGNGVSQPKGLTAEQAQKYVEEKGLEPMGDEGLKLMSQLMQPAATN